MCFVWISEQTAIISLYINWLVLITEIECLLRGTDWVFNYNSVLHNATSQRTTYQLRTMTTMWPFRCMLTVRASRTVPDANS
jgi:hypothetical protein